MTRSLTTQGQLIVNSVFTLITKHAGKETSMQMKKYFFNIVGKLVLLYQEDLGSISEIIKPLQQPNFILASHFLDQLSPEVPIEKRNPEAVIILLSEARSTAIGLLPVLFKEETVSKAIRLIEYFLETDFFHFVLKNPENHIECEIIRKALSETLYAISSDNENARLASRILRKKLLTRRRLLNQLTMKPSLYVFLRREDSSLIVREWLTESEDSDAINRINFHAAVEEYKGITSRTLLPERAKAIVDKFFINDAPEIIPFENLVKDDVINALISDNISRSLFVHAQREAFLYLNNVFERSFVSSQHFLRLQDELVSVNKRIETLFKNAVVEVSGRLQLDKEFEDCGDYEDSEDIEEEVTQSRLERLSFWSTSKS